MKAWKTIPGTAVELTSIVAAENIAKAKYITVQAARDAGFDYSYIDIKATRQPQYDKWAQSPIVQGRCWREDCIK